MWLHECCVSPCLCVQCSVVVGNGSQVVTLLRPDKFTSLVYLHPADCTQGKKPRFSLLPVILRKTADATEASS